MIRWLSPLLAVLLWTSSAFAQPSPGHWQLVGGGMQSVWYQNPGTGNTIDDDTSVAFAGKLTISGLFNISAPGLPINGHVVNFSGPTVWTGAVYDARRGIWSQLNPGGHSSTFDNSVFAANVLKSLGLTGFTVPGDAAPAAVSGGLWDRWTDPTPSATIIADVNPDLALVPPHVFRTHFSDGKPNTAHNVNTPQHMLGLKNEIDRYLTVAQTQTSDGQEMFEYDPHTKTWASTDTMPALGNQNAIFAWDPFFLRVLGVNGLGNLYGYNSNASPGSKWSLLTSATFSRASVGDIYTNGTFDKRRMRMAMFGYIATEPSIGNSAPGLYYIDFDPFSGVPRPNPSVPSQVLRFATLDLSALPGGNWPFLDDGDPKNDLFRGAGFLYDEIRDKYVIYKPYNIQGGGDSTNMLFYIDPDTFKVTLETSVGAPPVNLAMKSGVFNKFQHIVSQDLYTYLSDQFEGVWVYKPADQSRTYGIQPGVVTRWYGEQGNVTRIDHADGNNPGGLAGGTSNTQQNKFQRGAWDTTRRKLTIMGGNDYFLNAGQTRGSNVVLQIDPSTANAGNGFRAAPWTSLTHECEGPSKPQPNYPENGVFVYDGPQIGAPGTGRDLFYYAPGQGAGANPPTCTPGVNASFLSQTDSEAVLNPAIPAWHDAYTAPYSWKKPSWWLGGQADGHVMTSDSKFHNATDSYWRPGPSGSGFWERHIIGSGNFVRYDVGLFDHGNNETEMGTGGPANFYGREHMALDPIGWRYYMVNFYSGKLIEFDVRKAVQAPAISGSNDSSIGANDATHNAQVRPANSGQDYVREWTIPGYIHTYIGGFDSTSQHGYIGFDEVSRQVVLFLVGGTTGDVYQILAFNPIDQTWTPFPTTNASYAGGYLQGDFIHGDFGVYDSTHNLHAVMGGKATGNELATSPTWNPTIGPFVQQNSLFNGTFSELIDFDTGGYIYDVNTRAIYHEGVNFTKVNNGTTTTFTNINIPSSTVRIAYSCFGCAPRSFTMFRPFGGPLIGDAPPPPGPGVPTISALTPSSAVVGSGDTQITISGSGFDASAAVKWGGASLPPPTSFTTSSIVQTIPSANLASLGSFSVTVQTDAGVSNARAFNVTNPPPSLSLAYLGRLRDRVHEADNGLGPDGALDGTFQLTVSGLLGRTITNLLLTNLSAPGFYDTVLGQGSHFTLGVATTLDAALLNDSSSTQVNFSVSDGGSVFLFASDSTDIGYPQFLTGNVYQIAATLSDSTSASANVTIGVAPQAGINLLLKGNLTIKSGATLRILAQ